MKCWTWAGSAIRSAGLLLVVALLAAGCGGEPIAPAGGRPQVLTTTAIIEALAKPVAGGLLDVRSIVGPGVDPHEFEAKAADVRRVRAASLVLRNGLGLDAFLDRIVAGVDPQRIIVVSDGIALRTLDGAPDPHVWHDPMNDILMVRRIARAFAELDPPNTQRYEANAREYIATLERVDAEVRQLIEAIPPANRKIVTDHDAFGYFIRRYGLQFVGSVIPGTTTGAEPSAKELAALEQLIRAEGVRAVFAENSVDPKVAARVAKDTGATMVSDLYGDTLGAPGSGAETLDGMLLVNARKIADALK